MSAFGQKQTFAFHAYGCILTINQRLLSAISRHSARRQYLHSERPLSGKRTFINADAMLISISSALSAHKRYELRTKGILALLRPKTSIPWCPMIVITTGRQRSAISESFQARSALLRLRRSD